MRPSFVLFVLLLGTGQWALATSSPPSLPSFLLPTHSGASSTSSRPSYSPVTPSSHSPHSGDSVSPSLLPSSLSASTSALLTTTATSGGLLTQPGPSTIPTTPYIFVPFPSPSSHPPIPDVYPESIPKHPPPVESPALVPNFALAWTEAYKKAKAKVGVLNSIMSSDSLRHFTSLFGCVAECTIFCAQFRPACTCPPFLLDLWPSQRLWRAVHDHVT